MCVHVTGPDDGRTIAKSRPSAAEEGGHHPSTAPPLGGSLSRTRPQSPPPPPRCPSLQVHGSVPHDLGCPSGVPWRGLNSCGLQDVNSWKDLGPRSCYASYHPPHRTHCPPPSEGAVIRPLCVVRVRLHVHRDHVATLFKKKSWRSAHAGTNHPHRPSRCWLSSPAPHPSPVSRQWMQDSDTDGLIENAGFGPCRGPRFEDGADRQASGMGSELHASVLLQADVLGEQEPAENYRALADR